MSKIDLTRLYQTQLQTFDLAQKNYAALSRVICRDLLFQDFLIRLQYNPARMVSTNAKIDAATLQKRPCFLCPENMPTDQQGIPYGEHYRIYINPYPIFAPHFTVPDKHHTPQLIENRFEDLLNLAFDFQEYTVFYNGPACGASAPDHFHFQMAPRNKMPLETDVCQEPLREVLLKKDFYSISTLRHYLRQVLILQSSDLQILSAVFSQVRNIIGQAIPYREEPMMNILAWFDNCQWTVCLFPRRCLRPRQFFAEGEEKILFSPGSVDMAGLIIVPRQEDFEKYSVPLLTDLFGQVSLKPSAWTQVLEHLQTLSR